MFEDLVENVRKDITGAMPKIIKKGNLAIQDIRDNKVFSRSKLRKWGIIPNPWKKKRK